MVSKTKATIDDLSRVPGKAELINGEIVFMSPTGGLPNFVAGEIFASLREYARQTGIGYAVTDNTAFQVNLPHRESLSPDAAYFVGDLTMKFIPGAPLFAVEVRSENDYGPAAEEAMEAKRADYFAAGTLVVWDIDLQGTDTVRRYRADAPEQPLVYRQGDIADAEPAVPGWRMAVNDLWPWARRTVE